MMKSLGYKLNDEKIWIKKNPRYSMGKRSIRRHEPIYHFVKTTNFYYNEDWLYEIEDDENLFSIGTKEIKPRNTSTIDSDGNILKTKSSSTKIIKSKCEKEGVFLDHQATFPIDVPMMCLLTTSKPNDIILDNFCGTSVTGQAVIELGGGRCFVGYEPSPEYMVASKVRLSEYKEVA